MKNRIVRFSLALFIVLSGFAPISAEAQSTTRTKAQVQSFDCTTVTDVPQIECEALVALYEKTNGAAWKNNTNWLVSTEVNEWYEILVKDGHVINIGLEENNLTGTLPDEIGNLTNLKVLNLGGNQLSGNIPS